MYPSSNKPVKEKDFNADGKPDILLAGNEFDLLPQFCRLDGNYGTILINEGKNNFSIMPLPYS